MEKNYHSLIESLSEKGLISGLSAPEEEQIAPVTVNIFASKPTFVKEEKVSLPKAVKPEIDGFDTDILENLKYRQISDMKTKLKIKVARLNAELEEMTKAIEAAYLHADKRDYQKMLESRAKLEKEIAILADEYKKHQLQSIVPDLISKVISFFGLSSSLK